MREVARQRIGTVFPVRRQDWRAELVEGGAWTTDADMLGILDALDMEV